MGRLVLKSKHRLLCGDSTNRDHVERLMGGEMASFCFTDPPYGVSYSGLGRNTRHQTITNDDLSPERLQAFLFEVFGIMPLVAGANVFICHADQRAGLRPAFESAVLSAGMQILGTIIWVKNAASMGWQDFRSQHEPILFACKPGGDRRRVEDRTLTTVWEISRDAQANYEHPTTKPVALVAKAIAACCPEAAVMYEPFSGSGTTLIAAEQFGRSCYAMELEPRYVDVAVRRWENLTGERAVKWED